MIEDKKNSWDKKIQYIHYNLWNHQVSYKTQRPHKNYTIFFYLYKQIFLSKGVQGVFQPIQQKQSKPSIIAVHFYEGLQSSHRRIGGRKQDTKSKSQNLTGVV
jgi:hypothetical protein